jgi:hypothetical protein
MGVDRHDEMPGPSGPSSLDPEMPRIVLWVLGAVRPLTYQDLGASCAIIDHTALFPDFHFPSREEVIAKCLGIIHIDPSGSVSHTANAAGILEMLMPTEDANVEILKTILEGITQKEYLGVLFSKPLTRSRFESIHTPEELQVHPWYGFLQYATLYWATHLRRIRDPLSSEVETMLRLLISPLACLTWVEALAIFTGQGFRISLSRILGLVADFCRDGGGLVTQETLSCLQLWMRSCHELLHGWAEILERFPGEVHHIQGLFLTADSIFRLEYNPLNRHWALPACTSLERQPLDTVLDEASRGTDYVSVLDKSKSRLYIVRQSRLCYHSVRGELKEDEEGFASWLIRCISLDTGTVVSEFRGQSPFGVVGSSRRTGYVTAQLALSDDFQYLGYQEYLEPDGIKCQYAFTYCWKLKDFSTVDDDHFGPCTMISRGVPLHSPVRQTRPLTFCAGSATLVHANGWYDVEKREPINSFTPLAIGKGIKVDSVHVSPSGNALVITRPNNGDSQSSQLELWACVSSEAPMTLSQTFIVPTPSILAISRSSRFVAFTHKLLKASPNNDQSFECTDDSSSECESDDDSEYSADDFFESRETHSFAILDTEKGSIGELYSYRNDSWDSRDDSVTRLRPDKAFFGCLEPSSSLFISRMKSGAQTPEGLIWRWSISGWINTGHIVFDWGCNSLTFNHDDSALVGIRPDGLFCARVDNLQERVVAVEAYSVRREQEYHRSCWRGSSLYYLHSDINRGSTYQVSTTLMPLSILLIQC